MPWGGRDDGFTVGPFRFVRAEQDRDVVIERNATLRGDRRFAGHSWWCLTYTRARTAQRQRRWAINSLPLRQRADLGASRSFGCCAPGTRLGYMAFNLRDPIQKDARVRRAIAYALDRRSFIT